MKDNNNIGISYKGILLNQHILQELPEDVLQWLEFYNSLSPDEQDTITYEPPELVCLSTPTNAGKTVIAAGSDVEELEIYPVLNKLSRKNNALLGYCIVLLVSNFQTDPPVYISVYYPVVFGRAYPTIIGGQSSQKGSI